MNQSIKLVNQAEACVAALKKIQDRGEFLAAGIDLDLWVGPRSDEGEPDVLLSFGMASDLPAVIDVLLKAAQDSLAFRLANLKRDADELQKFIAGRTLRP